MNPTRPTASPSSPSQPANARLGSRGLRATLATVGVVAGVIAAALAPSQARAAATQDWPPFVLVAGLLLIGLLAETDGLFAAAGDRLAAVARGERLLFCGAVCLVAVVTALLNLDTSVAFLTPVLVYTARRRGTDEAPLLYGCLLVSNAGSLLLPGSNLTNLIVIGNLHMPGGRFLAHMALPDLAAVASTALILAVVERRNLRVRIITTSIPCRTHSIGLGALAVATATVLVVFLRSPALPVAAVGATGVAWRLARRREGARRALEVLGLPILVGLYAVAVALGTLGRTWSSPAELFSHLDLWGTGAVAALASVTLNNLPAASLLAARVPHHPFALLVGLDVGPNLFATGSLAWFLWLQAARTADAHPSIGRASRLGVLIVPCSLLLALVALAATSSS